MYTIKLMNEFLHGPIWVYDEDGFIIRKYPLVFEDMELMRLNEKARRLYDSFYSFNENNQTVSFDESGYKEASDDMKHIISMIVNRLKQINNNDFIIEDYISSVV